MWCDVFANSFMVSIENPLFVNVFEFVAMITEPLFLLVLSLIIASYFYFKSTKIDRAHNRLKSFVFAGTTLSAGVLIKILKEFFMRARPSNALISEVTSSMPSGHTTFAVVFFGLLACCFMTKKTKVKWIIVSSSAVIVIAFSRLYLRVHWATDVLVGFVLGSVILGLGIFVYRTIR